MLVLTSSGMCLVQLWAPTLVLITQCPLLLSSLPGPAPRSLQLPWKMTFTRRLPLLMTGRVPSPPL